jgi:hypothetical protein
MTTATASAEFRPRLWTPGDWNAFFGFGMASALTALDAALASTPAE